MKIVYSYYVLDILHTGHLVMMENAKRLAGKDGKLIVGILTDEATMEKKSKPIMSFIERFKIAESIKYADLVVIQDTYSPIKNLSIIKPNILVESSSHDMSDLKQTEVLMNSWGGKMIILPYFSEQSSTKIKREIEVWKHK